MNENIDHPELDWMLTAEQREFIRIVGNRNEALFWLLTGIPSAK